MAIDDAFWKSFEKEFIGGRRGGKSNPFDINEEKFKQYYEGSFNVEEPDPLNIKRAKNFNNLALINLWYNKATKTWEFNGGLNAAPIPIPAP